jgi:hypothetical protein
LADLAFFFRTYNGFQTAACGCNRFDPSRYVLRAVLPSKLRSERFFFSFFAERLGALIAPFAELMSKSAADQPWNPKVLTQRRALYC